MRKTTETTRPVTFFLRQKMVVPTFIAAVMLYWVGLYLYSPTLPLYAQDKTSNLAWVGVVLSMYGLWQLLTRLPLGIAVDWAGWRKPFILAGLGAVVISAIVMAQAGDISMLGAGRALSGIGAATWVPLVVMFSSLYTPGQVLRSTGILAVAGGLGRIMATALTGTLNDLGGYSLAFNLAAVAALAAIFLVFLIPDERQPVRKFSLKKLENLVLNPLVVVPSLLSALLHYGDWSTWASFTPILARQYGGNDVMISLLVSLEMGFSLVGNLVSTMIVHRIGHRRMIYASFLVLTTGIGGLALAPSLGFVFAAQTCIGLAFGMAYPVLMGLSINKIEPEMQNSAMGLHQSVYSLGMFAGPWMSGILADALRIQPMLGITAGAVLLLSLIGIKKLRN